MTVTSTFLGKTETIPFPGRTIKFGETDKEIVKRIQHRLNEVGCGPITEDGNFSRDVTEKAVKLFQARFPDVTGRPLVIDGKVGSLTWGALFGGETIPSAKIAPSKLTEAVITFAKTQIGIMEQPLESNRGPEIDEYLRAVGLNPMKGSFPWCVAFTHYCYKKAAEKLGIENPHTKTAGVLDHWNVAGKTSNVVRITNARSEADPSLIRPGSLFIIDFGSGFGHSGIVAEVVNGRIITIEGNTNNGGSREGIGVFQRDSRKIASINKGFIDYGQF